MENYKFSVPVRINFIADETTLSVETVEDLDDIQEKYDIDLQYIIDEYEYKIGNGKDDDDEEYFGISEEDIFNEIINDNWDDIVKKLNKEYKLDDLNEEHLSTLFQITKEDFNKNFTVNNFDNPLEDVDILSIEFSSYNRIKNEFYINVSIDAKLKKDEIENLRAWLDIEITEKWGEEFSKIDLSDKLELEDMYVYLIPWSLKKDMKYIKN